jgi:transcriptional regulator with XRE-family HTH domain
VQIGQRLSEARRRRNLTLADIARTTKIRVHYLEAIDRDDVDRMPRGFFGRAFVRAYANEVGVNPSELMDSVDKTVSAESEPDMAATPAPANTPAFARALFFIIPVAAVCGFYFIGRAPARTRSKATQATQVAAEIPSPTVDRVEPAAVSNAGTTSDVELQIQSRGGCIVAVTADGRAIPADVAPGQPVLVKARGEVVLRVGNSGTCASAVKSSSTPKSPRRAQIDTVSQSPHAITLAVDQPSETTLPVVETAPSTPDAVLPQPESTPPPAIEPF